MQKKTFSLHRVTNSLSTLAWVIFQGVVTCDAMIRLNVIANSYYMQIFFNG